jgi:hypothetical protein
MVRLSWLVGGDKFVGNTANQLTPLGKSITLVYGGLNLVNRFSINALSNFGAIGTGVVGFTSGTPEIIGYSFYHGGNTCYGWASITITENSGHFGTITINEWAYEDSGSAITVGAVPEPAQTAVGLGALALGAAGLRRWRKAKAA